MNSLEIAQLCGGCLAVGMIFGAMAAWYLLRDDL